MNDVKPHFFHLPDILHEDFARARNATGLFSHLSPEMRPGFHEVRSTGSFLYEDQAVQTKVINTKAHSDIEIIRYYQSDIKSKRYR